MLVYLPKLHGGIIVGSNFLIILHNLFIDECGPILCILIMIYYIHKIKLTVYLVRCELQYRGLYIYIL